MDELGFPINSVQVRELVKLARKAPFGKGSKTVLDTTVRSAWEIDAGEITFSNRDWNSFIESLVQEIKPDLGLEGHSVSANLYKLLIYEEGDFFLPHKDSEKEKGMFGTLIVGLPAQHTGGELLVSFDGKTKEIDFAEPTRQYKIPFAAFYADCEHEIKPIKSGHRVCLVYNLVQTKGKQAVQIHKLGGYVDKLATILKTCEEDQDIPKIVLLGHQYTPANFTMEALKLNDRPKAEALLMAAEKAGFYAKLGLVTSFQTGELEIDDHRSSRSGRGYYDDYYDDDLTSGTMGEVFDEYIEIEHWMSEGVPPLRNIQVEAEDLISPFQLNEGEPIEKEAEGYTGNAGMEMAYWYHYGAVFLWPKKYQYDMLVDLTSENKLEWIHYYNRRWNTIGKDEQALVRTLVEAGLPINTSSEDADYSPIAEWLINLNDERYLRARGTDLLLEYFAQIRVESWVNLIETFTDSLIDPLFTAAAQRARIPVTCHLLAVLRLLSELGKHKTLVQNQTECIPDYLSVLNLFGKDAAVHVKRMVQYVLALSTAKSEDATWLKNTTEALTRQLTRDYVNDVLIEGTLKADKGNRLATSILAVCRVDLTRRVENPPQPPADWSRPVPNATGYYEKTLKILTHFLKSPVEQVFEYRRVLAERKEMEYAIQSVEVDLRTETIKKGSPHLLRIIKTQAAYEKEVSKWKADVELLKKMEAR